LTLSVKYSLEYAFGPDNFLALEDFPVRSRTRLRPSPAGAASPL
jgi:hypothetical protein